jgi:quinol monooxygenase YgiN
MIHVVAIITAKPGMREAILKEFRANVPAVHAEQGCIEYGPAIDTDTSPAKYGDDTFVVIEKWESVRGHRCMRHARVATTSACESRMSRLFSTEYHEISTALSSCSVICRGSG